MDETELTPPSNIELNMTPMMSEPMKRDDEFTGFDIPIFTEEFLDHNKGKL